MLALAFWWLYCAPLIQHSTEEYNGSTWTAITPGLIYTARNLLAGAGTQTVGLGFWWRRSNISWTSATTGFNRRI
jgi:hypothetical protein